MFKLTAFEPRNVYDSDKYLSFSLLPFSQKPFAKKTHLKSRKIHKQNFKSTLSIYSFHWFSLFYSFNGFNSGLDEFFYDILSF